ncbi:MAG: FHA domain-containing protein [Blastococcus sp.]
MSINERPEFAAAMRGYDRQQVDDYVQVVLQYVEELELRASEAAEAAGRVRAPHSAPPGAQAEPARARVHALSVAEMARVEADRVVAAAWAEAQQIVQAAKSEAALITATSLGLPPAGRLEITAPQHCVREGFLSYRDDSGQAQVVALRPPSRWAIGRAQGSDVPLGWDSRVSRWHAQIERAGNEWWLIDDGMSTNGTFVNEAAGRAVAALRRRRRARGANGADLHVKANPGGEPAGGPGWLVPTRLAPGEAASSTSEGALGARLVRLIASFGACHGGPFWGSGSRSCAARRPGCST